MNKGLVPWGTQKEERRRKSSWENFQPGRDEMSSLGKNDKRKGSQKAESEKVRCRILEKVCGW